MRNTGNLRTRVVASVMLGVMSFVYGGASRRAFAASEGEAAKPAASTVTAAKDDKAEAKLRYASGEAKFRAADYSGALADFKVADGIKATPHAARYIGLCEEALGHPAAAIAAFERFLADVPPKLADQAPDISKRVTALKALPATLRVESTPAGARVFVDGAEQPTATPLDLSIPPGKHALRLTSTGFDAVTQDVSLEPGANEPKIITLVASAAPAVATPAVPKPAEKAGTAHVEPSPVAPERPATSLVPALVTGGIAVAALGVGTVYGLMALQDEKDFKANPSAQKADDGDNHALVADMGLGVALTLGVTSLVLLFSKEAPLSPDASKTASSITAVPMLTHNGGGASALLRF